MQTMSKDNMAVKEEVWKILNEIPDPEIPVVTIIDLGIVRDVIVYDDKVSGQAQIEVKITPTYSGCPAMDMISMQIRMALTGRGYQNLIISEQLFPAWTTDWITTSGKEKMRAYGIAPPKRKSTTALDLFEEDEVDCPRCHSTHTSMISQFSSTSCKSMYRCLDCKEPFEHFKCH